MRGARIRYQHTGDFHFVTFSCYRRSPYLSTVGAMELFEDALQRVRQRYLFVVAGYVVMPGHVHLLVNEPQRGCLAKAILALKLSVSVRTHERPFWQAHSYDFNGYTHPEFVEKLRSIHRNPVRRELVAKPEDWRWSSYRHSRTGVRGTVEIESERTAAERGGQLPEWMRYGQSNSPSPVPKSEGPGAPSTEENAPWDRDNPPIKPSGPKARSIPAWGAAPGRRTPQFQRAEGPTYRAGGTNRIVICANSRFPNRRAPPVPKCERPGAPSTEENTH
jgi:putative transposase